MLVKKLAIAVLGSAVLLCVGLFTPIIWTVIVESGQPKIQACDSLKNPAERLACVERKYDTRAHPARDATAPLGALE